MSAKSCDEFTAHHRYDSDSSLDTVRLPRSCESQLPGTILHRTDSLQNLENIQILSQGHLGSDEGYTRSSDTECKGDKTAACTQGHSRSQVRQATNDLVTNESHSMSAEGHSMSNYIRCIHCGCETSNIMNIHDSSPTNNSAAGVVSAELDEKQGSAATRGSRCGGHSHDAVDTQQSGCGDVDDSVQGRVGIVESRCGGHDWSDMFKLESYSGAVSRELCHQLVQLLTELDSARDLNIEVRRFVVRIQGGPVRDLLTVSERSQH